MVVVRGKFSNMKFSLAPLNSIKPYYFKPPFDLNGTQNPYCFYDSWYCKRKFLNIKFSLAPFNPIMLSLVFDFFWSQMGFSGLDTPCIY